MQDHVDDVHANADLDPSQQELDDRDIELLNKLIKFIVESKVSSMLAFMMNSYKDDLSQEVLDMIKDEIKANSEDTIREMLQCACMGDEEQWFAIIGTDSPTRDQAEHFGLIQESVNQIFETATYNPNLADPIFVNKELMESMAQKLLEIKELKANFARQVSQLTQQAARGLESEGSLQKFMQGK